MKARPSMVCLAAAAALAGPLGAPIQAQAPSRLAGRVLDATNAAPVGLAELELGDRHTTTGTDGSFAFGGLAPGALRLRVRRIGYSPASRDVELVPGIDRWLTIVLRPLPLRLDSIRVITRAPLSLSLSGAELTRRGRDLARALDGWEGVVVRRTGAAGAASPQVRGGSPDETLVLVDGFTLNDPFTGRADLSRIPSREVARVTLLPGAQTVRFGSRAVAGVILVETRPQMRPEASTWVGSYGARGLRLGASAGALTASASGERYPAEFDYPVPEVRGGGEASRLNSDGVLYTASARLRGPAEISVRGSLSQRGLPGTTVNPTPAARAEDRSVLLGVRREGPLRVAGSLEWLETQAADPRPPTGAAYDAYTHGTGYGAEVGYRRDARVGRWTGQLALAAEGRGDRFAGDGVRPGSSFTRAALRLDGALQQGPEARWSVSPAIRLDGWTGATIPRVSARLDAGWHRGPTSLTASLGSGVTPPVLADLIFREGVGVRLNPDLRPERIRWEIETGARRALGSGGSVALRLFYGRVADMIVWGPDFRFIWSPRNFDVLRRGAELSIAVSPARAVRLEGSATFSAVTYDTPGGAQVQYRPRTTAATSAAWVRQPWGADLRWHYIGRRYPNSAGTNPRSPISFLDLGLERRLSAAFSLRAELRDAGNARAEFIAGYPTPGRTASLTLDLTVP